MKFIGVIPARYKSSRFPGKPLAQICGKPMVWWVYQQAKKVEELDALYVATDDERIAAACEEYGLQYMMTSESHRTGADRVAEVASKVDGDIFLNIKGDEPLINPEEIRQLIRFMEESGVYYGGLKTKITTDEERMMPNVVKAITNLEGDALYFSRMAVPYNFEYGYAYRVVGLFAYEKQFLLKFQSWGQSVLELSENGVEMLRALEHGYTIRMQETEYTSVGVDFKEQIPVIERMIKERGNR